jgi:hypothetical protein
VCRRSRHSTRFDQLRKISYADEIGVSGGFMGAAINVGEVYAHLVRDLHAGTYSAPGFDHALHNARLIDAVRCAAERGERQKVTR